jgi:hypothetical protein
MPEMLQILQTVCDIPVQGVFELLEDNLCNGQPAAPWNEDSLRQVQEGGCSSCH